jgi:hypothetical protein
MSYEGFWAYYQPVVVLEHSDAVPRLRNGRIYNIEYASVERQRGMRNKNLPAERGSAVRLRPERGGN